MRRETVCDENKLSRAVGGCVACEYASDIASPRATCSSSLTRTAHKLSRSQMAVLPADAVSATKYSTCTERTQLLLSNVKQD